MKLPFETGHQGNCHIQGIAVDPVKGFLYCSFTTKLLKYTLDGALVGSVDGLTGHLGCIDFNDEDGKVYGSLEYKNDAIGQGIKTALGAEGAAEDGFYIAVFDVDRIDRMDMDAARDGIMTAVYLKEVCKDYTGTGRNRDGQAVPHRYGCSGIDGMAIGPMPGDTDGKQYLFVCYGIYSDLTRDDNDHQVILCYDPTALSSFAQPLSETHLHKSGPDAPLRKFFLFTGNTRYGVQNFEYDKATHCYFAAVYQGEKPCWPNYGLFAVDASVPPVTRVLRGMEETGECLTLKKIGEPVGEIWGTPSGLGSTGLYAFGDGRYLLSRSRKEPEGQCSTIREYVFDPAKGFTER